MTDWFCPNCGDLIEDEDDRIEHLVSRHNTSINIAKLAGLETVKKEREKK